MEKKLFLIWYDPELKEVMNIEKEHATKPLLAQLSREGIEVCEVYEENMKKANEIFLQNIEALKPNVSIMASGSDFTPVSSIANMTSSAQDSLHPVNLDEVLDAIDIKKTNKKLH